MDRTPKAKLQWVMLEGKVRHVSDFSHLSPPYRPNACCPFCKEPVIMKLGNERIHHVAHQSGADCILVNAESIIHFNTKMHIASELEKGSKLVIEEKCGGSCVDSLPNLNDQICLATQTATWFEGWDRVEVELFEDGLKPDIGLWKDGLLMGVIEVYVTHRVDDEKAKRFESMGVEWIEVLGEESLYSGEGAWNISEPLPIIRRGPSSNLWMCPDCQQKILNNMLQSDNQLESSPEERVERESVRVETICWRIVDFYYSTGKWYRSLYTVEAIFRSSTLVDLNLSDDKGVLWENR
ncbi:MAG: hypothetical protein JXA42_12500 [Anaerolineales bacterium]|nr:hypothetical protein [Anaerolineales bacterium]